MNPSAMQHRIFVVGAPRSGTTLVQSLLASHPDLTSFPESHLFSRHFKTIPPLPFPFLRHSPLQRLRAFLGEAGIDAESAEAYQERLGRLLRPALLRPLRTREVARELLAVLDDIARSRQVSGWVEKTPMHLYYVKFLESFFPDDRKPHFVHVVRRGLDVVTSLHAASMAWKTPYAIDTCVERWNQDVAVSLKHLHEPQHHFVVYEALVNEPDRVTRRLFESLGLDWQDDVLQRYAAESQSLITNEETWKSNNAGAIEAPVKSTGQLDKAQLQRVTEGLDDALYREACRRVDYSLPGGGSVA